MDGKSKLDHVREMFDNAIEHKKLPFRAVLMDSWYAAKELMLHIERSGKIYYCPLKDNRQVDESDGIPKPAYRRVDSLEWSGEERESGKNVHVKDFPKRHRLQLFRLVVSADRTDYVVINDETQRTRHKKCVPFVGRLSNCTAKPNKSRDWKAANVANKESNAITSLVRCWSGVGSKN